MRSHRRAALVRRARRFAIGDGGITRAHAAAMPSLSARLGFLALLFSLWSHGALAQVNCTDLPNPVIGAGGSASVPLLARVGAALHAVTPAITLVYQSPGACFGITPYVDGTRITGTASYWDEAGAQQTCNLPVTGVIPDFGMLGTSGTLCEGVASIPAGIGDFAGPVTSWSLIVPTASSQQVISGEALYFIYGFGAIAGRAAPWTDPAHLWGRNATSAALIAIALAAGVPPERMASQFDAAHDVMTNGRMITQVAAGGAIAADATLGFVSTEVADGARDRVRTLAYQHYDQSCGYWPDSTATGFDKANVRDGHYYLWSAYHFYAPVDGGGTITDPDTRRLVGWFTGQEALPAELPLLDLTIDNGNIPECAMRVWRDSDLGPLYSYLPEASCSCYYEFRATGETSCSACEDSTTCPASAPTCRHGYCEVR
jgi:hypothetical protein